ncbi:MAG: xanthine dehydrogenase family protein subunit M [Anaerolineae bacterium]|nr:xanthine dehydrogenase family protein subunit M [Anaerolineae bacterium]
MKLWEHYYTPTTIDEAVALLQQHAGQARVIAGGTDLLVDMRAEGAEPHPALVDITCIPELSQIDADDDTVTIGAGVTHTQIVKSSLLSSRATCLVESCGVVGGPQVRNVATLGGNVAHALPAADGTTSLVALDAQVEVIYEDQRQWLPLLDLFLGPGQSLLDSTHDLLLHFCFPLTKAGEATAFKRIMRPQGVALPVLGCAVWVQLDEARTHYQQARVCIAPVGPRPVRVTAVEDVLAGKPVGAATLEEAVRTALDTLKPRTSKYRATADYRREMIAVLLRRTLPLAVERAQTGEAIPEDIGV